MISGHNLLFQLSTSLPYTLTHRPHARPWRVPLDFLPELSYPTSFGSLVPHLPIELKVNPGTTSTTKQYAQWRSPHHQKTFPFTASPSSDPLSASRFLSSASSLCLNTSQLPRFHKRRFSVSLLSPIAHSKKDSSAPLHIYPVSEHDLLYVVETYSSSALLHVNGTLAFGHNSGILRVESTEGFEFLKSGKAGSSQVEITHALVHLFPECTPELISTNKE